MALPVRIEACVDTLESALNAAQGGADRVELCDNLADGGTTPSHATLMFALERVDIPVFPIIRVRGGGFVYSDAELDVMREDVRHARELGAPGIVLGALTPNGDVDADSVDYLRAEAGDMAITFHRAIDVCRDPLQAIEALIRIGVDRVLTSGQRATAWEGRQTIAKMVRQAAGRIVIMAGGSIDETTARGIVRETGVREIHVRGAIARRERVTFHGAPVPFRRPLSGDEELQSVTDASRINAIRSALSS